MDVELFRKLDAATDSDRINPQNLIIDLIRKKKSLTKKDIKDMLKFKDTRTKEILNDMIKKELIERRGKARNTHYVLKSKQESKG